MYPRLPHPTQIINCPSIPSVSVLVPSHFDQNRTTSQRRTGKRTVVYPPAYAPTYLCHFPCLVCWQLAFWRPAMLWGTTLPVPPSPTYPRQLVPRESLPRLPPRRMRFTWHLGSGANISNESIPFPCGGLRVHHHPVLSCSFQLCGRFTLLRHAYMREGGVWECGQPLGIIFLETPSRSFVLAFVCCWIPRSGH